MLSRLTRRMSQRVEVVIHGIGLAFLALVVGLYVFDVGWHPEAEGMFAEFGARVADGHWPHVHFEDDSLGGLSLLNAALFSVMNPSLLVPRVFLLAFFATGLFAMLAVLSKTNKTVTANLTVIVCLTWGPSALLIPAPQWYVITIAMLSCLSIIKFVESHLVFWLVVTGVSGGLAFLLHPPLGCLLAVAVGFSLILLEPAADESAESGDGKPLAVVRGRTLLFEYVALSSLMAAAGLIVWQQRNLGSLLYYMSGPLVLVSLLLYKQLTSSSESERFLARSRLLGLYVLSAAAVIAPFILVVAVKGGMPALITAYRTSFVRPFLNISASSVDALQVPFGLATAALLVLLALFVMSLKNRKPIATVLIAFCLVIGFLSTILPLPHQPNYRWTWAVWELCIPATIILGSVIITNEKMGAIFFLGRHQKNTAILLLLMLACFSFVRLPENNHASLLYVFPFFVSLVVVLSGGFLDSQSRLVSRTSTSVVYAWLICLGMFSWLYNIRCESTHFGEKWTPIHMYDLLRLDRAKIYVTKADIHAYEGMARVVNVCTDEGDNIIAFPNSHISYFLTDRRNPFFGYGMPRLKGGTSLREAVESALDTNGANARVVLYNSRMDSEKALGKYPELKRDVARRIPVQLQYGHFMTFSPRLDWLFYIKQHSNPAGTPRIRKIRKFPWGSYEIDEWVRFQDSQAQIMRLKDSDTQLNGSNDNSQNADGANSTLLNGDLSPPAAENGEPEKTNEVGELVPPDDSAKTEEE